LIISTAIYLIFTSQVFLTRCGRGLAVWFDFWKPWHRW